MELSVMDSKKIKRVILNAFANSLPVSIMLKSERNIRGTIRTIHLFENHLTVHVPGGENVPVRISEIIHIDP